MSRYIDEGDVKWGTPAQREKFPLCRPPRDEPQGYLQWHDWAKRKGKTHRQVRCRNHGWFHNWVAKKPRPTPSPAEGER